MNHSQNTFCSEVELSKFLSSSIDTIQEAYDVLLKQARIRFGLYTTSSGIKVLAFMTRPLLDSDLELDKKAIDFISTGAEVSLFSVNKIAIELFNGFNDRLKEIENEHIYTPLIITGWGLGGMLAILSALRLQRAVDVEESKGMKGTKRPMCITFGAPLVGGEDFQQAIIKRPQWKSGFLNVVVKKNDGASFFERKERYKPFGTFLFCTESGHCTVLEDEKAIMAILETMVSPVAENLYLQDYKKVFSSIRKKVLVRRDGPTWVPGVARATSNFKSRIQKNCQNFCFLLCATPKYFVATLFSYGVILFSSIIIMCNTLLKVLGMSLLREGNTSLLKAGIALQLKKVGVSNNILIDHMETQAKMMIEIKKNSYDSTEKLNDAKIRMSWMEWYIKTKQKSAGYYDSYKNGSKENGDEDHQQIAIHHDHLNQYWKKFVEEKNQMPQKDGASLRKRWLYTGNNYRWMIEPLVIGEYYKKLNKKVNDIDICTDTSYIANRPEHYKMLEKWLMEDEKNANPNDEKQKAFNLSKDSLFWANVEEAIISLKLLMDGSSNSNRDDSEKKLKEFMDYVMRVVNGYMVSSDVFLEGSSLRKWWDDYNAFGSCDSEFARYMKSGRYKLYK